MHSDYHGYITIEQLKRYYLYSLELNIHDFTLLYGREFGQQYFDIAVANHNPNPTLTGFIRYVRNSVNLFPNRKILFLKPTPQNGD